MKFHGQEVKGPNIETIVIPRHYGDIVFEARAVLSYKPFEELCPRPVPPYITRPGKKPEADPSDKFFLADVGIWGEKKFAWLILNGLAQTPGLTWDTVDLNKHETWLNYKDELATDGFTEAEVGRLIQGVMAANGLDESKVEEARNRFLASQAEKQSKLLSLTTEQTSTPSGEPANG